MHIAPRRMAGITIVALVLAGGLSARAQVTLYTLEGDSHPDQLGNSVASIGDVNGDGRPDIVVGAPGAAEGGQAFVHSGADGSTLFTLEGGADFFGAAVAGAGDVNADGHPDILVGSYLDVQAGQGSGAAWVFSGADGSVLHLLLGPAQAGSGFGYAVAGAGDVDGDGHDDVLVGAPFFSAHALSRCGGAWVHSGADGSVLLMLRGEADNDYFGISVSGAGDVDGDGVPDLLIGSAAGYARLHSGRGGAVLLFLTGDEPDDAFGEAVAGVGDVDGDGRPDLAIGAPLGGLPFTVQGEVHVLSGQDGSLLHLLSGDATTRYLGHAVAAAGDVNGDGHADIIAGAPSFWPGGGGGNFPGIARLYSGADGSLAVSLSSGVKDRFGAAVAGGGDVNGDGHLDFLVGAPYAIVEGAVVGRASIVSLLPPHLDALSTDSAPALGGATMTAFGQGLSTVTSVQAAGGPPSPVNVIDDSTVSFKPPVPPSLGPVSVTLANLAGEGNALVLEYVQTDPPALLAPSVGEVGAAFTWSYGAAAGAPAALLTSLSSATTLLGGLTVLEHGLLIDSGPLDAAGLGSTSIQMPAAANGLQFYSQLVTFDGGLSGASNIVWTWVLF